MDIKIPPSTLEYNKNYYTFPKQLTLSIMPTSSLPLPTAEAATHSQRLTSHIVQIINDANGAIPFAEFMALALYAPRLTRTGQTCPKLESGIDSVR